VGIKRGGRIIHKKYAAELDVEVSSDAEERLDRFASHELKEQVADYTGPAGGNEGVTTRGLRDRENDRALPTQKN